MGKVELYPHNQEAYKKIEQSIANGDKKIAISHATGTGKSYLIAKLCEEYNEDKKLVLVPSRHIKKEIKCLLKENNIKNVDVKLYQGLIKMSDECISAMNYKIVALDEYHHDTAKVWGYKVRTLIDSHTETIFFGTSATPVRTDGVNVIDELFDGNCVSNISLAQAIARGIVPCPKYVAAFYTLDERLNELRRKIEQSTNSKEEKYEFYEKINTMRSQIEKSYGMPIILNNNIKDREGRYIVFCKNKKHLEKVKETVIDWFKTAGFKNINSYVVHSSYESKDEEYEAFCNDTSHSLKLLFCINMLNEGSHKTNISGALLLRKTNSYIMLLQQIGRTIESGKTNNPIIIDAVNNFIYVKDGIKLLTEIKEAIEEEKKTNKDFDESKFIDIDTFFVTEYVCDVEDMLNEIENKLKGNYELYLRALEQYKDREGNCLVPERHKEVLDGLCISLGRWCSEIRKAKKGNKNGYKLTLQMEEDLNLMGFVWDISKFSFEKQLFETKKFIIDNGRYPKAGSDIQHESNLGYFVSAERTRRRKEQLNYPKWKIEIIEREIPDFCWEPLNESFYKFIHLFKDYQKTTNNTHVDQKIIYKGYELGKKYRQMKSAYKKGKLSEDKKVALEDAGFILNDCREEQYENNWRLLEECVNEGIILTSKNKNYKGVNLYSWLKGTVKTRIEKGESLSEKQAILMKKALKNYDVKIIDLTNGKEYIYSSPKDASIAFFSHFNVTSNSKTAMVSIVNRMSGKTNTPYKDRFLIEKNVNSTSLLFEKEE